MHRCLQVPELTSIIAELILARPADSAPTTSFSPFGVWSETISPSALVPFSLTCRYFHRVAIRLMWRTLPKLRVLRRCLPYEVVKGVREPTPDEWNRVLRYTENVTTLKCRADDVRSLPGIKAWATAPRLFPKLKCLILTATEQKIDTFLSYIPALLPPKIESIAITSEKPHDLFVLTEAFANNVPYMRQLSLRLLAPAAEPNAHINAAPIPIKPVSLFKHVRYIVCPEVYISRDLLVELGTLRYLKYLWCSIRCDEDSSPSDSPFEERLFRSLDTLCITSTSVPTLIIDLLKTCKLRHLEYFDLWNLATHPRSSVLNALMKALATHKGILEVRLYGKKDFNFADPQECLLTHAVLRPLYQCRHLRALTLRWCPSGLDDDAIGHMASAWPALERLSVGTAPRCATRFTNVTWNGLKHLVSQCPELTAIELCLKCPPGMLEAGLPERIPCPRLQKIALKVVGRDPSCSWIALLAWAFVKTFPDAKLEPPSEVLNARQREFWSLWKHLFPVYQRVFGPR